MLVTQVSLQVTQPSAVKEAQTALVRFDVLVLPHVQMQVFSTGTGESALVTAEDDATQVSGQLRPPHLYWNDALL